jgi:hypothetical protein
MEEPKNRCLEEHCTHFKVAQTRNVTQIKLLTVEITTNEKNFARSELLSL